MPQYRPVNTAKAKSIVSSSGWQTKNYSALFVELLGGGQVQRFPRDAAAYSFVGDVTQDSVFPGVSNGEK